MDIEKLKALALAAAENSSNWTATGPSYGAPLPKYLDEVIALDDDGNEDHRICAGPDWSEEFFSERTANMEYIAASCPATVLELIAEVERLRARFGYIEGNATTSGGGHGFTVSFFVPEDCEDIGCGIDAAIEAHTKAGKEEA